MFIGREKSLILYICEYFIENIFNLFVLCQIKNSTSFRIFSSQR